MVAAIKAVGRYFPRLVAQEHDHCSTERIALLSSMPGGICATYLHPWGSEAVVFRR